jgi:hypothetical protein
LGFFACDAAGGLDYDSLLEVIESIASTLAGAITTVSAVQAEPNTPEVEDI